MFNQCFLLTWSQLITSFGNYIVLKKTFLWQNRANLMKISQIQSWVAFSFNLHSDLKQRNHVSLKQYKIINYLFEAFFKLKTTEEMERLICTWFCLKFLKGNYICCVCSNKHLSGISVLHCWETDTEFCES